MNSWDISTVRFSQIDETNRGDHSRLTEEDKCAFLWEFTTDERFEESRNKSRIYNIKKKPTLRGTAQFRYKAPAMRECAEALSSAFNEAWLQKGTLVPVPPSKAVGDPDYDDRMYEICSAVTGAGDVRKLVVQTESTEPFHTGGTRLTVEQLRALYEINEELVEPEPSDICIVDDVLTAGTHFKAMQSILAARFPGATISGVFLARRKLPAAEPIEFPPVDDDELGRILSNMNPRPSS